MLPHAVLCGQAQAARLSGWQIGKTRVFLRAGQLAQLEGARGRRLTASAVTIQASAQRACTIKWKAVMAFEAQR